MKASASARANLSAIRVASQPSMSKAASSSSRCDALGSADSSCSGIEMRSICGVSVSAVAVTSSDQPAPTSVASIRTSKEVASTVTTLAIARRLEADRRTD
jgi:hypothetical protein